MKYIKYVFAILVLLTAFYPLLRGVINIHGSINFFGVIFNFYGLIIAAAIFIVIYLVKKHSKDDKINEVIDQGFPIVVITALIFARFWHVATDFHLYENNLQEIIAVWKGGLSIFGGLLGGLLAAILFLKNKRVEVIRTLELVTVFVPLGQAIGRFANFVNQELFGYPTELPWGVFIRPENRPEEFMQFEYFHPAFLYEAFGSLILFFILFRIFKREGIKGRGKLIGIYMMGYGIIRFLVDFFRMDPDIFYSFSVGQVASMLLVATGLVLIALQKYLQVSQK